MLKRRVSHAFAVLLAAMAMITFGASTASAADTSVILSDIDGHQIGYLVHLDADPDRFKICDDQQDGHGVTGRLYIDQGVPALVATFEDGDDAGCDTVQHEITQPWDYIMVICWNGPGDICGQQRFNE